MNEEQQERHSPPTAGPCLVCSLEPYCLQWNVSPLERMKLEAIIERPRPFADGEVIFRAGDDLRDLYAVRYGVFKSYDSDGQVNGFSLPGEFAGLDGVQSHRHHHDGVAHGESAACALPYDRLIALMAGAAPLRHQFMRLVNRTLARRPPPLERGAEERLAGFLLDVSRRLERENGPALAFDLPLGARDLANYLKLAPGELEDVFLRFSGSGLLDTDGVRVRLRDASGLQRLAGALS